MDRSKLVETKHGTGYLSREEIAQLKLTLYQRLTLWLFGGTPIGKYKPKGFNRKTTFYLIKYNGRCFISYRQGWAHGFYLPEAVTDD